MAAGSTAERTPLGAPRALSSEEPPLPAAHRRSRQRPPEAADQTVCLMVGACKSYAWLGQLVNRAETSGVQHSPRWLGTQVSLEHQRGLADR